MSFVFVSLLPSTGVSGDPLSFCLSRPGPLPFVKAHQKKAVSVWGLDRAKGHVLLPLQSSQW